MEFAQSRDLSVKLNRFWIGLFAVAAVGFAVMAIGSMVAGLGWPYVLSSIGFELLCVWLLQLGVRTRFTEEGIEQPRFFGLGGRRIVRWREIQKIEQGAPPHGSSELKLSTAGQTIELYLLFYDVDQLMKIIEAKVVIPSAADHLRSSPPK